MYLKKKSRLIKFQITKLILLEMKINLTQELTFSQIKINNLMFRLIRKQKIK